VVWAAATVFWGTGLGGFVAFESIPTIMRPQELVDKAFSKASKIEKPDRDRRHRQRKTTLARLEAVRNILNDSLGRYVRRFPSLDQLEPYHRELIRLLIGEDRYRLALGRVEQGRKSIVQLLNREMNEIGGELDVPVLLETQRRAYGRTASKVAALQEALSELERFRETLRRLPAVAPGLFTVVIAGYPNVGKSSLIQALTDAEPEVASYPFTTKQAHVGHMELTEEEKQGKRWRDRRLRVQIIDTPGLLDRPEEDRNAIEQQAALALRHLADMVLFLRDPTGHCGYPVEEQERLLEEVKRVVPDAPLFVVETKADLEPSPGKREDAVFRISTVSGDGVSSLRAFIVEEAAKPRQTGDLEAYLRGEEGPA
jgi:nucleolar GTP-binding protein